MNLFFALLAGLIFGLGLIVAGMANPAKVLGFLDIGGLWDPSLALVMAAAVAIATLGFTWAKKRKVSLLGQPLQLPTSNRIDRRLIGGSLLFGAGWGLAGICPGPALVLLGAGMFKGVIFVAAMVAGMAIFSLLERAR
ncbi:YeeE/YedE thiosulfate transporter family protein [Yersinia intermedia]|nr:YeeE/YedE thiosulfate transporter family protein [Yersinia intermedia]